MPRVKLPRILHVKLGSKALSLKITWEKGHDEEVNLVEFLRRFKLYAPLLDSPKRFQQVQVGEFGADLTWGQDIDISVDTLLRLTEEQRRNALLATEFKRCRQESGYSVRSLADSLGLEEKLISYYEDGVVAVPKVVLLATQGLKTLSQFSNVKLQHRSDGVYYIKLAGIHRGHIEKENSVNYFSRSFDEIQEIQENEVQNLFALQAVTQTALRAADTRSTKSHKRG